MSKAKFVKHLKELNIEEMRHELLGLYDKVSEVKKYYAMELGSDKDRKKIFDKAKKEIAAKYATKSYRRPRRPRIQKINAIISKIEKAAIFKHELIDLYLFDLETALVFIAKYNFYSKVIVNHTISIFKKAMKLIDEEFVHDMFKERCENIVDRSVLIYEIHMEIRPIYKRTFE